MKYIPLDWKLQYLEAKDGNPLPAEPLSAQVPGAVQRDWARHHGWPEAEYESHTERYTWMEDVFWRYSARLPQIAAPAGETVRFEAEGIDYAFEIFLNGRLLHESEGMFAPVSVDLGASVPGDAELVVLVHPIPKAAGTEGRAQAKESCKPACAYGWDWHPRLVPSGIWRPCRLRMGPTAAIVSDSLTTDLSEDLKTGALRFEAEVENGQGHRLRCRLTGPEGEGVAEGTQAADAGPLLLSDIADPKLWWPREQGRRSSIPLK